MDRDVVFPAPFGPTRPARDPRPMSRSIPATASLRPKLLRSPRTEIACWAAACPALAGLSHLASPSALGNLGAA